MWSNKFLILVIGALPLMATAIEKTACPAFLDSKDNVLKYASLFDGPVSENAQLKPDYENGTAWDVRGYEESGRTLHLICEYKNGAQRDLAVAMPANRCYAKGKKTITAWCGK